MNSARQKRYGHSRAMVHTCTALYIIVEIRSFRNRGVMYDKNRSSDTVRQCNDIQCVGTSRKDAQKWLQSCHISVKLSILQNRVLIHIIYKVINHDKTF